MDSKFLFVRLKDGTAGPTGWNGNDKKGGRTHHDFIPEQKTFKDIALHWRVDEHSPLRYIGTYRLDLLELLNAGYIRKDVKNGKNGVRLKFVHAENDCIYIQEDSGSPRLIVGVFE